MDSRLKIPKEKLKQSTRQKGQSLSFYSAVKKYEAIQFCIRH